MTIETIVVREIKRLQEQIRYYEEQIAGVKGTIEWMHERLTEKGLSQEEIAELLKK